jgi:arginine/lysine/ornithine decarboxylase
MLDIKGLSEVCREYGLPLLVDNAHGAYLKFLPQDMHPITLGAAMCADSAHKTLPVLTGGAYLHVSADYPEYIERARDAMSLFASTSPSYLTLCSLDLCNKRLSEDYPEKISALVSRVDEIKKKIRGTGLKIIDGEPLKIVIKSGEGLAEHLRANGIEVEFSDRDYTVLMLTPENTEEDLEALIEALASFNGDAEKSATPSVLPHGRLMSIREAMLSPSEVIPVETSVGRILASPTVSCPPAVPIVVSGERITERDVEVFKYYGIDKVSVIKLG